MGIKIENFLHEWSQFFEGKAEQHNTEATEKAYNQALEVLGDLSSEKTDLLAPFVGVLSKFQFNLDQNRKIYAALSHADLSSPQVKNLIHSNTPFSEFAEIYTLKFAHGELKASKAELCSYGKYFKNRFSQTSAHEIDLQNIPKESFEFIQRFSRGEIDLDSVDSESFEAVKDLAAYFAIEELEMLLCRTIDEAINIVENYQLNELDLLKYEDDLQPKHIDQILALPTLKKADGTINLKALFPKLSLIDDSVWKAKVDFAYYGLNVDAALDEHSIIQNLYEMHKNLKIENDAGITYLTMPQGLTLRKLLEIATPLLIVNPNGEIWDRIVGEMGDIPIMQTYTIAIINSVLQDSRTSWDGLSMSEQEALPLANGCEMPNMMELLALNILTNLSRSKRLYSDNPNTYAYAAEKFDGWMFVVGNFSPEMIEILIGEYDDDAFGVAVARRFYQ